jgi:hypothetical protein
MTEDTRVALELVQLKKIGEKKTSKLVFDEGGGQDLRVHKNAMLPHNSSREKIQFNSKPFWLFLCIVLRDVAFTSRCRAGNAFRFCITSSNASKYRGKITTLNETSTPCLHFTPSIHQLRGLREASPALLSREVHSTRSMRYLLEIVAALAAHLAGKDSVLTSVQIYPNGNYPGAIDPFAEPGAQSLQTSPPFYPSPWMNGQGEWAGAYAKAKDFVSQLTLLEKVNLTTGVGWEGEQCVGQVNVPS